MKITIDTKEDSHHDIQKVIKMLQHLVGEQAVSSNPDMFADTSSDASSDNTGSETNNAFANMFGGDTSSDTPTSTLIPEQENPKEESSDDQPQVELY